MKIMIHDEHWLDTVRCESCVIRFFRDDLFECVICDALFCIDCKDDTIYKIKKKYGYI